MNMEVKGKQGRINRSKKQEGIYWWRVLQGEDKTK